MIPILGIPILNRYDLLLRCIRSIDYPVNALMVIQNGPDDPDAMAELLSILQTVPVNHFHHVRTPNLGCSASWNHIILSFPSDYWMIGSNDIQFSPGDLEKMHTQIISDKELACLYGNHGASWFGITQRGVHQVGSFDCNFYPGYLEDCDWSRRADLLGVKCATAHGVSAIHGDGVLKGSCTIMSDPEIRRKNHITHGRLFEYYRRKWGGNNGHEVFTTPFNDPSWPIWAWKFDPEFRKGQVL